VLAGDHPLAGGAAVELAALRDEAFALDEQAVATVTPTLLRPSTRCRSRRRSS